jgi:MFS family permease
LLTLVHGNIFAMYFCYAGLVTMGTQAAIYNTSYKAVNRWFIGNRGLAIGLVSMGSGYGSPIMIPVVAALVVDYGWQGACTFIGVIFIAMGVTSALTLFREDGPEESGLYPDNRRPLTETARSASGAAAPVTQLKDFTAREAMKIPAFWWWTMGAVITGIGGTSVLPIYQNLRLQEAGLSVETAALWYSMDFIFSAVGRTSEAVIGDRVHPRWGYGISLIVQAAGFYCFAVASNTWWLVGYAVLHGIGYGYSIPAAGVIVGALFGRERYATIRGLNLGIVAVGSFGGPILFGFLRDSTGSYFIPFAFGAAAMAINGVMLFFCSTPKGQLPPGRRAAAAGAE